MIFLIYPATQKHRQGGVAWYDWLWVGIASLGMGYLVHQYNDIMTIRGGIPNTADIMVAILTVLAVLEVTRRITGLILVLLLCFSSRILL